MGIRQDITTKWIEDNATISVTSTVLADGSGKLDLEIPNGTNNLQGAISILLANVQGIFITCDQAVTLTAGGVNAKQRISMTGPPTAGTFTTTLGAATSTAIQWNSTAAAAEAILRAMASIGADGVNCTGGPLPGTPIDCEFVGAKAAQPIATMMTTDTLTGGSSSVSSLTTGVVPDTTIQIKGSKPLVWGADEAYFANPFAADVSIVRATNISGVDAVLKIRTASDA